MDITSAFAAYSAFAAFVWLASTRTDLVLTKESKQSLGRWIRNIDVGERSARWAAPFSQLIDKVFGRRHFSLKCFLRSSLASFVAVLLLGSLWYLQLPKENHLDFVFVDGNNSTRLPAWMLYMVHFTGPGYNERMPVFTILATPFVMNVLPDYFALLETRWTIKKMAEARSRLASIGYLALNMALNLIIAAIFFTLMKLFGMWVVDKPIGFDDFDELLDRQFLYGLSMFSQTLPPYVTGNGIFIYSTFLTTLWAWLFVMSGALLRAGAAFGLAKRKIEGWFDVDDKPLTALAWVSIVLAGLILAPLVFVSWTLG